GSGETAGTRCGTSRGNCSLVNPRAVVLLSQDGSGNAIGRDLIRESSAARRLIARIDRAHCKAGRKCAAAVSVARATESRGLRSENPSATCPATGPSREATPAALRLRHRAKERRPASPSIQPGTALRYSRCHTAFFSQPARARDFVA